MEQGEGAVLCSVLPRRTADSGAIYVVRTTTRSDEVSINESAMVQEGTALGKDDGEKGPPDHERRLQAVLRAFLDAVASGEDPDAEELVRRHPEFREELATFFESRAEVERLVSARVSRLYRATDAPTQTESAMAAGAGATHCESPALGVRFGQYELVEQVAKGGMGVVYRARSVHLDRDVALKVLLGGHIASDRDVQRFRREARAAARLDHPNVATLYDVGEVDGRHYFTMEFLEGGNLADRRDALQGDFGSIARIVETVARAVHHAHGRGILHRDLKPENILFDAQGEPHVADFGLSRAMAPGESITQSGAVVGTPAYMAPEQASGRGETLTPATDVYGLGVVLYELLAQRRPFTGRSSMEVLRQVEEREAPPPSSIQPAVPRDLETICLKCLRKDPMRRYESAAELADDLARYLAGVPVQARRSSALQRAWSWARRNRMLASMGVTITVLLLVVTVGSVAVSLRFRERLWRSFVTQARAALSSREPGRRSSALQAIAQAARIRVVRELRDEAIASLALVDIEPRGSLVDLAGAGGGRVALDGRGLRYASGDATGRVTLRRVPDGRELLALPAGPGATRCLRFDPSGRYLGVVYERPAGARLWLWDLESSSTPVAEVDVAVGWDTFDFAPRGPLVAAGQADGSILLVDRGTGAVTGRLESTGKAGTPSGVKFRPDARALAVCDRGGFVEIRDVETGASSRRFSGAGPVLAWHPAGHVLATSSTGTCEVAVWDCASGKRLRRLPGHRSSVTSLAFWRDAELLLSSSWDGTLRLWDYCDEHEILRAEAGFQVHLLEGERAAATVNELSEVLLWDLIPPRAFRLLVDDRFARSPPRPHAAVFGGAGGWFAVAEEGVSFWAPDTGKRLARIPVGPTAALLVPESEEELLTLGARGFHRWPLASARDAEGGVTVTVGPPEVLESRSCGPGACLSASRDGRWLARIRSFREGRVVLTDRQRGTERVLAFPCARFVSVSPCGRWVAAGAWHGTGVRVWETANEETVIDLPVAGNAAVAFHPDSGFLVTGSPAEFVAWNAGSWKPRWRAARRNPGVLPGILGFAPDGDLLAVAHGIREVRLLRSHTGEEIAALGDPDGGLLAWLTFSRGGRFLAAVTETRGSGIWDLWKVRAELRKLGLDWDSPGEGPPAAEPARDHPVRIEVRAGYLAGR